MGEFTQTLRGMMAERGIYTARGLHHALIEGGHSPSYAQVCELLGGRTQARNQDLNSAQPRSST